MSKSQKKGPAFLLKTFDMLQKEEFKQIIDWISDGSGFVVKNANQLAQKVLPIYFKHSNMHSFIRQLNMYGFNKKRGSKIQNYYFHPLFQKGQREMIGEMQRKAEKKGTNKELTKEDVLHNNNLNSLNSMNNNDEEVSIEIEEGQQSHEQNKENKNVNQSILGQTNAHPIAKSKHQTELEQSQIKKRITELMATNKALLLEQIYHLANIQNNNLICYRQRLQQDLSTERQLSCDNQTDTSVLERLNEVKNKYLRIHSMVWDKINSMTEGYGAEIANKAISQSNDNFSVKQNKPTEEQISKHGHSFCIKNEEREQNIDVSVEEDHSQREDNSSSEEQVVSHKMSAPISSIQQQQPEGSQ